MFNRCVHSPIYPCLSPSLRPSSHPPIHCPLQQAFSEKVVESRANLSARREQMQERRTAVSKAHGRASRAALALFQALCDSESPVMPRVVDEYDEDAEKRVFGPAWSSCPHTAMQPRSPTLALALRPISGRARTCSRAHVIMSTRQLLTLAGCDSAQSAVWSDRTRCFALCCTPPSPPSPLGEPPPGSDRCSALQDRDKGMQEALEAAAGRPQGPAARAQPTAI